MIAHNKAGHTAAFGGWTRGQAARLCRQRYASTMRNLPLLLLIFIPNAFSSQPVESVYDCNVISDGKPPFVLEIRNSTEESDIAFSRIAIEYLKPAGTRTNFYSVVYARFSIYCQPGEICEASEKILSPGEKLLVEWDGAMDSGVYPEAGKYQLNISSKCPNYSVDDCSQPIFGECEFVVD